MPEPYSLLTERWIPVALEDGRREFISPLDISQPFNGQPIIRIATGRPDCDISLTEFLIGLLAISIGPEDNREWHKRYRTPPSRAELEAALKPFEEALILDGNGPRFFQDLEPLQDQPSPIQALFIDAPGAQALRHNSDHFVKRGRTGTLSRAGAAIALLTLQTCAPAGGSGIRTSLRGGGPLTTLAIPGTKDKSEPALWQRLWANVPQDFGAEPEDAARIFPWLAATRRSDKGGVTTTPQDVHPAQAFFGMPRRIRLIFEENKKAAPCDFLGLTDEVIVTGFVQRPGGTNYAAWSRGHPLSPYYKVKKDDIEYLPLHLKSSRVGYRQWLGLVAEDGLKVPADCVAEFRGRRVDLSKEERDMRLLAAGYAMDNMKPLDFAEAALPLFIARTTKGNGIIADHARNFVKAAEIAATQLVYSIKRALFGEKSKAKSDSTVLGAVRARFWADTEDGFYKLLRQIFERAEAADEDTDTGAITQETGERWRTIMRRHALDIFDETAPIEAAESAKIEDVIAGRKRLTLMFEGYTPEGRTLFECVGLTPPELKKPKKGKKPHEPAFDQTPNR